MTSFASGPAKGLVAAPDWNRGSGARRGYRAFQTLLAKEFLNAALRFSGNCAKPGKALVQDLSGLFNGQAPLNRGPFFLH